MLISPEQLEKVNSEAADFELCQEIRGIPPGVTISAMALCIGKLLGTESTSDAQLQRGLEYLFNVIGMTAANHLADKVRH